LKNAAEKRAAITAPGEAPGPLESLEDILAKVKEAMAGLDFEGVAKRTVSVTGTFSAMAAGRMGAGGPIDPSDCQAGQGTVEEGQAAGIRELKHGH